MAGSGKNSITSVELIFSGGKNLFCLVIFSKFGSLDFVPAKWQVFAVVLYCSGTVQLGVSNSCTALAYLIIISRFAVDCPS